MKSYHACFELDSSKRWKARPKTSTASGLYHMGLKSPQFKILQTRAFHSNVFVLLSATTLSCCISSFSWIFYNVPKCVGFQTMVILDPYDMAFDDVGVFGLAFHLLFRSWSTYCAAKIIFGNPNTFWKWVKLENSVMKSHFCHFLFQSKIRRTGQQSH